VPTVSGTRPVVRGRDARVPGVVGWDIGGVNTKVAHVAGGAVLAVRVRPFELQRAPQALAAVLRDLAAAVGMEDGASHAVTLTAELSQLSRTKREGVGFVLDAVEAAFRGAAIQVFTTDGQFVAPAAARLAPLAVAAANWAAAARAVARHHPDAVFVDVGTTTTDVIPIVDGAPAAEEPTDPGRLASGELVYTGALRTPVEAIASRVPFDGRWVGVSAEGFALAGDVHLWRGDLAPADYTCTTPDGRPATREFAGERLARVICGDRDLVDAAAVSAIADEVARAQVERIAAAIGLVRARHRSLRIAVVAGLGAFLGRAAACAAGLQVEPLAIALGEDAARAAPAAAVALLLDRRLAAGELASTPPRGAPAASGRSAAEVQIPQGDRIAAGGVAGRIVDIVVKIGGGVIAAPAALDAVVRAVGETARERRLLVVPGGGPFADTVRTVDAGLGLSDDAAHWMAVLAMDQYAHLLASRLPGAVLVADIHEIGAALHSGRVPVLAPYRWLREADPLPHLWDVTSDSLAAWVSARLGASRLVLVKPPGAPADESAVDPYFQRAVPRHLPFAIVPADRSAALRSALGGKIDAG
jgi:probable H4MPT-linked C1 transfer pathway protein